MKIVVASPRGAIADAAAAAFSARDGVDFGRVKSLDQAVEIAAGAKDTVVLFPVEKATEKAFEPMKGRGAKVIVLSPANPAARAMAFAAGAWDVIFPPHDAPRMEAAIEAALGRPLRKWKRCPAPIPADVLLPDGSKLEGRVGNMSMGGAQVLLREAFRPDVGIVRIVLRLTSPYQAMTLFARPVAFERPPDGPGVLLRAQFAGLSVDEEEVLQLFVDSLESSLEEFAGQLRALQKLDLRRLRDGYSRGLRLPTLAACEQAWVAAAPGTHEADLAMIALARCRALMVCTLFESFFEAGEESPPGIPPFRQWRGESKMAGDLLRQEISARLVAADVVGAKELRDLEARFNSAADHLERIAERVTGQKRAEKRVVKIEDAVVRSDDEIEREHIVEAAEDAAQNAGAPVQMETTFLSRPDVRRWIGIVLPTLVFAVVVMETRYERHKAFPPAEVVAQAPMFKARNVNVRTFYQNVYSKHWIAIVDSTWWKGDDAERWRVTRNIAEQRKLPAGDILEVRSYQGDVQALWVAGPTPPDPPPDPFPKSGLAGSDVSGKPPS